MQRSIPRPSGTRLALALRFALVLVLTALALSAAVRPEGGRAATFPMGAGIAYADSCDSCATNNPPIPIYDPEGPNP